ncbi:MAG: ATP-binding protein, partial [Deltaproteobacteria bacterium]|nr:ATP-binding protein [Deltaproteobacteria bacterium]
MILTEVLVQDEGKTLEFKENCRPSQKILQTVVAFANTAGGTLVLGVRDRTKEVVGLSDPLKEEERLANLF